MDAGKLRERLELLVLGADQCWTASKAIWGSASHKDRTNIFAKSGFGAAMVEFVVRRQPITLQNAIRWNGLHCMITAITEHGNHHLKLTTAVITLYRCTATRPVKIVAAGKPRTKQEQLSGFEATLTEKYYRSYQEQPQTVAEKNQILVTPKAVDLSPADIVNIGLNSYVVVASYTLALHCNEYELLNRREV